MQIEIDTLKSALDSKLDAGRVTDSTSVTEAGWALDARHANAGVAGSMANMIQKANEKIDRTDAKFAGLKSAIELPNNYVMNYNDFSGLGFYNIGSLAQSPAGNAPDNNVGDYKLIAINNNHWFQVLIMTSPRDIEHIYIGGFWNKTFVGWGVINVNRKSS